MRRISRFAALFIAIPAALIAIFVQTVFGGGLLARGGDPGARGPNIGGGIGGGMGGGGFDGGGMGGTTRGGRAGSVTGDAVSGPNPYTSVQSAVTDLTDDQKARVQAESADFTLKLSDWTVHSQNALEIWQPAFTAGQPVDPAAQEEYNLQVYKQNLLREDLINDAEIKVAAILKPDQAERWEIARLTQQVTARVGTLDWTAVQKAKAAPLMADAGKKLAAARGNDVLVKTRAEFWNKIAVLLTEVQVTQVFAPTFEDGRGGRGGGAGGGTNAYTSIQTAITDLTGDQEIKLQAVSDYLNTKLSDWQTSSQAALQPARGTDNYAAELLKQNLLREDLVHDGEMKMVAILKPDQAEKWETWRLTQQVTARVGTLGWTADQKAKAALLSADGGKKLAAAKDKETRVKTRAEFWNKIAGMLTEVQITQVFAPTFVTGRVGRGGGAGGGTGGGAGGGN